MGLENWLSEIAKSHPVWMDLGLDRIKTVAQRLALLTPAAPVITVTGTNGKGSCVAVLEQIYRTAGFKVGVFQSPYFFRVNEEIRLNGKEISDKDLESAFSSIREAQGEISLTLFEYLTLAALLFFKQSSVDLIILEVGLGGRLDAVNIVDASLAIVTSIGLDHADFLGKTRTSVAREKAGIFRPGCPVVCGDRDPPKVLIEKARQGGCPFYQLGQDFEFEVKEKTWDFLSAPSLARLPLPKIYLNNAAVALMAVALLQKKFPVSLVQIREGLAQVELPGRIQEIHHPEEGFIEIFDVAHNPAAVELLAKTLPRKTKKSETHAVFSMLKDKDIAGCLKKIRSRIDFWHIAPIPLEQTSRAATLDELMAAFNQAQIPSTQIQTYPNLASAYQGALTQRTSVVKRRVVFGSFYTVQGALSTPSLRSSVLLVDQSFGYRSRLINSKHV